jgi:hypothetical protein
LYFEGGSTPISRAQAEQRMFAKLAVPRFMADIRPLLSPEESAKLTDEAIRSGFISVFDRLIARQAPGRRLRNERQVWNLVMIMTTSLWTSFALPLVNARLAIYHSVAFRGALSSRDECIGGQDGRNRALFTNCELGDRSARIPGQNTR